MAATVEEAPPFLPEQVGNAWALLAQTAVGFSDEAEVASEVEEARWAAVEASFHDRPGLDLAQAWADAELRVIEAAEAVKAWADFQGLSALRRLHEAVRMVVQENVEEIGHYTANAVSYDAVVAETITSTVDEVALATGLPEGAVAARLDLAKNEEGRCGLLLASLAEGQVTLDRALRIQQATSGLDPEVAGAVAARLLVRNPDGSVRSHRSFTRELRRQVVVHTLDPAEARAEALRRRCAYGWLEPDGTGRLTVVGDVARVTAALDRVDRLARSLRGGGDSRTLEQLRSDVALDLILHGWADSTKVPEAAQPTFVGQPPSAHVSLVVALTTLLGVDDQPGEIPGHGFVPAAVARNIAMAGGSVWRRLVTDPADGTCLELSTNRYRPTAAMAQQVAALDGTCQAPGCTIPADRCDLDHDIPWPAGPTHVKNLKRRHRRHHNHKTRGSWKAHPESGGRTRWTTVSGREYLSYRHAYQDPLAHPVSERETQAVDVDLPPPF
jgi:hypothetical protein